MSIIKNISTIFSSSYTGLVVCMSRNPCIWRVLHWVGSPIGVATFVGLFLSVWSTLKAVFRQIRLIRYAYELRSCLDLGIWRFLCSRQWHDRLLYPLAHACGIITHTSIVQVVLGLWSIVATVYRIQNQHSILLYPCIVEHLWFTCTNWCDHSIAVVFRMT